MPFHIQKKVYKVKRDGLVIISRDIKLPVWKIWLCHLLCPWASFKISLCLDLFAWVRAVVVGPGSWCAVRVWRFSLRDALGPAQSRHSVNGSCHRGGVCKLESLWARAASDKKWLDERTHIFIGLFFLFLETGRKYIKRGRGRRSRLKFC